MCNRCKKCYVDNTFNYGECLCEEMSPEDVKKYFENNDITCPYFEAIEIG